MATSTTYTTKQWILASKPSGAPVLSGPDATFKLQNVVIPPLKEGQILCKVLYFSNDTGLRNFIQSRVAPERFYVPTVPVGSPMRSGIIAEVLESASPTYKPGDLVMDFHLGTWSELVTLDAANSQPLSPLPNNLPLTHYLGAFGASGLAAYSGLVYAGGAKAGDTIVISAAAGATGSMAVQIAVQLLGAKKVIGIAGSDEKCAWVRDHLGAHECINYKSSTFLEDLKAVTPDEVDVYFDNVGGDVLDAMLTRVKRHGTIAVCGHVSGYNSDEAMGLKNWFEIVSSRITIRGFIMLDYLDKAPAILQELIGAAADGRIKLQDGETVVEARIEEQPEIWMRLFSGGNQGKLLTKLIV
ncbi:NAD(P)-binding protein [Hypoxylon trugodes]|uniref:NAD(P)-binding protein n=1 Tax=Hypoxylon trugodes TaxID=326681 RepID=UPI00219A5711|nr:NAD(P)-binding protein [Hypoxylon trugodes]KAI1383460.1 NAD(P)-binding protein [Hypoxylon trugodes]